MHSTWWYVFRARSKTTERCEKWLQTCYVRVCLSTRLIDHVSIGAYKRFKRSALDEHLRGDRQVSYRYGARVAPLILQYGPAGRPIIGAFQFTSSHKLGDLLSLNLAERQLLVVSRVRVSVANLICFLRAFRCTVPTRASVKHKWINLQTFFILGQCIAVFRSEISE